MGIACLRRDCEWEMLQGKWKKIRTERWKNLNCVFLLVGRIQHILKYSLYGKEILPLPRVLNLHTSTSSDRVLVSIGLLTDID